MIKLQLCIHCRQRAPVGNALSSFGTSQIGIFDIQGTTKSKYYDHIVLLYLESRKDVVINQLFLFVFTYMFLWLTSSIKISRMLTKHFRSELLDDSVYCQGVDHVSRTIVTASDITIFIGECLQL